MPAQCLYNRWSEIVKNVNALLERCEESGSIILDGFDDAIIGIEPFTFRIIYSVYRCIYIISKDNHLKYDEASEYFYHNVISSYVGEMTPIFCDDDF